VVAAHSALAWLAIVTWVFTTLLLLLALVSTIAAHGRLAPNSLIGIRTPQLKRSESAWRAGHAAAVPLAWTGFVVALICAIFGFLFAEVRWGVVAVFPITVIAAFSVAIRAATKVA
jgi:uncharacterized membrane protein